MVHVQLFKIVCLTLMCLPSTCSQSLYENDYRQYQTFNRESRDCSLHYSLDITRVLHKKTGFNLKECNGRHNDILDAYNILMGMYNQGLKPNDSNIAEICVRYPNLVVGSSSDCHRFYDCSKRSSLYHLMSNWKTPYLHECPYPFMFSEETLQCENYTEVVCGTRYEPKWECRYFYHLCKLAHCKPCEYRFPKCENRENGLWAQPMKGNLSSFYMICLNRRTIKTGDCPKDKEWNEYTYVYKGQCVHRYAIPSEYNSFGYLPSCNGKTDGNYQYHQRCDAYYKCEDGVASAVKCPNGTVFDAIKRSCENEGSCPSVP